MSFCKIIKLDFVLFVAVNEMRTSFDTRKLTDNTDPTTNLQQKKVTMMNNDEILQVRCMHDQFYNIIMSGFPIDIAVRLNFDQINIYFLL
jgi:hypothetical protein